MQHGAPAVLRYRIGPYYLGRKEPLRIPPCGFDSAVTLLTGTFQIQRQKLLLAPPPTKGTGLEKSPYLVSIGGCPKAGSVFEFHADIATLVSLNVADQPIVAKEKELAKISRYKQTLYQDWKDGEITRNDYRHMSVDYATSSE